MARTKLVALTSEQIATLLIDRASEGCEGPLDESCCTTGKLPLHLWCDPCRCCIAADALKGASETSGWRPIESHDGSDTPVLLWWPFWCKLRPIVGWFGYKGIQQWIAAEALEGDGDPPIAWMPLPAPPPSASSATTEQT